MLVYWAMFAVVAGAALIAKPVQHTTGPQSQNGLTRAYSRIWRAAAAGFLIAIIGLRYDATEIMQGVTEVLCYGTAVQVEPKQ